MRISDWSSDVCSSDLAGSSHGFLDRVSRRLLLGTDRHHAAVSVESELVVSDKRTEFPREGSHLVLAVESVDPEEQRLGDAISNKRGTHAGRRDGLEDVLDCRLRSEEHASELQSLMRISYAVFCLKKKTTCTNLDYTPLSPRPIH